MGTDEPNCALRRIRMQTYPIGRLAHWLSKGSNADSALAGRCSTLQLCECAIGVCPTRAR